MAQSLDFTFNGKDKTQQAFRSINKSISRTQQGFDRLKGAMGALAGVAGVTALSSFASNMSKTADRIGKVASKLGISTEALQKFQFSAEQSGVSTETLNMAFQRFTRRIADAKEGAGPAVKAFEQMGISLSGVNGQTKTAEALFFEVADAMKGVESETEKVKLAFKLFDSEGVGMINMLQNGSEAIIAQGKQLEDYGGIIDEKAIRATERFNDAMNLFSKSARGAFSDAVLGIDDFIKRLVRGYENLSKMFGTDDLNLLDAELMNLQELEDISKDLLTNINRRIQKQNELNSAHAKLNVQSDAYKKVGKIIERMDKGTNKLMDDRVEIIKLINMKQGQYVELVEDEIKAEKEALKTQTKQQKFYVLAIDGVTRIGQAIDENGNKINLLTKEQADQLTLAIAIEKAQIAQKEVSEAIRLQQEEESFLLALNRDLIEDQNNALDDQSKTLEKNKEIGQAFIGGIKGASASATRFFDAVGLQIVEVGKSIELTFSTNWIAILTRFAMSSKKVRGLVDRIFSTFGNAIDKIFDKLLPGLGDANQILIDTGNTIGEVLEEIQELGNEIDDYNLSIQGITGEALEMARIESQYLENRRKASRLDSGFLLYVADLTKQQAILARTTERVARATEAFKQSASSYITALETAGFTDLQKDLFLQAKGFITGPMKIFGEIIQDSSAILSTVTTRLPTAQAEKDILQTFMAESDFGRKKTIAKSSDFLMSILGDQLAIIERGVKKSDFVKDVKFLGVKIGETFDTSGYMNAMARYNEAVLAFTNSIPDKALNLLNGEIESLNKSLTLQNSIVATNTDLMNKAQGGLLEMVKETIKSEFESGKSKESILADIDVVSAKLKEAGINITTLKSFIEDLFTPGIGAMGGLVKKYPYGGSISGPSHSSGGVMAELEGGEFVMRKSSVQKYGSDFMNQVNQGQHGGSVDVSVYLDMEGQVKLPLHQYIVGVQSRAERAGNPELAGILAG